MLAIVYKNCRMGKLTNKWRLTSSYAEFAKEISAKVATVKEDFATADYRFNKMRKFDAEKCVHNCVVSSNWFIRK